MNKMTAILLLCISFSILQCSEQLTGEEAFNKGKEYYTAKDFAKAYTYFKKAIDKSKDNPSYQWAAAKSTTNRNLAFIHTQAAWDNGMKTFEVLVSLTNLSLQNDSTQKLQQALSLFKQLSDTGNKLELRADLFNMFGQYDSSLAIYTSLFEKTPSAELCNKITIAYGKKGEREKAISFMKKCHEQKLLNSEGYLILAYLYALEYDYKGIDQLFDEAQKMGYYTVKLQVEHAGFSILSGNLAAAESLLVDLAEPVQGTADDIANLRARVMLSYIYRAHKEPEKIKQLIERTRKAAKESKDKEIAYYSALIPLIQDSAASLAELDKARGNLPRFPVIELIHAREHANISDYEEAIKGYKNLPDIFMLAPNILIEYAVALTKTGRYDDALSLINVLHKKKRYTKNSLELFRDITLKKQLLDKSLAAQTVLENLYKDDAGVQYKSAILALKTGDSKKALQIINDLITKYPAEKQFELAKISMYLYTEDYKQVIEACRISKLPVQLYGSLLAKAYIKLGNIDSAEKVYTKIIEENKTLPNMIEYAQFLIETKQYGKATSTFENILKSYKDILEKDSVGNAIILNNFAWSLLQTEEGSDNQLAVKIVEKAYKLAPKNLHILDTYATALMKNNKYKECISLLSKNTVALREPALALQCATAYEKKGDDNKAMRLYQQILELPDSTSQLKIPAFREEVKQRIAAIAAKK